MIAMANISIIDIIPSIFITKSSSYGECIYNHEHVNISGELTVLDLYVRNF